METNKKIKETKNMTKANVKIELKKGDQTKINEFIGEERGVGITQKLIYTEDGSIILNGVKVQGNCIKVVGNLVSVGFVEVSDCYEVEYPSEETKKYLGKSYYLKDTVAELWNTTSNPQALDSLQFTTEDGNIKYSFIMKEYL